MSGVRLLLSLDRAFRHDALVAAAYFLAQIEAEQDDQDDDEQRHDDSTEPEPQPARLRPVPDPAAMTKTVFAQADQEAQS
ncbi:hypothetical protein [Allonocardiopsis opalescens]|uniref:Uncharacterized protein n=1 Tax=Allonocardiopsis opalescens TaxID=1144618 RepID=A0A2T0Q9M6_9ACTN|nr:hypothetical protein [Allonocardiopsis opalescens]PRY00512.1 hypothetical protein CLV72_102143 [Allonocardiopsis opalescens]